MNQISKFINYATSIFRKLPEASINIYETLAQPVNEDKANTLIDSVDSEILNIKYNTRKDTDLPFLKDIATNLFPALNKTNVRALSSTLTSPFHANHKAGYPGLFESVKFLQKISVAEGADLIRTFAQAGLNEENDPIAAKHMATGLAHSILALCYCAPYDATKEDKERRKATQQELLVDLLKASISHPNAEVKESVISTLSEIKYKQVALAGSSGNNQMTGVILDLEHIDEIKEHIDSFIYSAETDGKRLQHERLRKDFLGSEPIIKKLYDSNRLIFRDPNDSLTVLDITTPPRVPKNQ